MERAFAEYAARVRQLVDASLARWLDVERPLRALPARVRAPVDALGQLAMRGGKRWRPVLLSAAYEGCGGEGGPEAVVMAGVAFELLQAYLLVHDDWMDGDEVRRGGPSVPAMLRSLYGHGRDADGATILAGDYGAALALEALFSVPAPPDRLARAGALFARIQQDVVVGQLLDLECARASDDEAAAKLGLRDVEVMHDLKTGSYTARGPLAMGAILAGASAEQTNALTNVGQPLGVAFQLRDDLLGTFGDPATTGKPARSDLREGKRTSLIAELPRDPSTDALSARVLGVADAKAADVESLVAQLVLSGAKARVESRLEALLAESAAALEVAPIASSARIVLRGAILAIGRREH